MSDCPHCGESCNNWMTMIHRQKCKGQMTLRGKGKQ